MADDLSLQAVYRRKGEVVRHTIATGSTQIGRRSNCELWLPDGSVSKIHATLRRSGQELLVEDRASRNGTFLNGNRIDNAQAKVGDVVRVGDYDIYIVYPGAPIPDGETPSAHFRADRIVLAAFAAIFLSLIVYVIAATSSRRPTSKNVPLESIDPTQPTTPVSAYQQGVDAYLRNELKESERYLRTSQNPGAGVLLELVIAELADLHTPPGALVVEHSKEPFRRVIRSDAPTDLRQRIKKKLTAMLQNESPPSRPPHSAFGER